MTLGEYRVGITFNPSSNPQVDAIKRAAADFIDLCGTIDCGNIPERGRLVALARTHMEEATMWAVKAATKGPMTDNPTREEIQRGVK